MRAPVEIERKYVIEMPSEATLRVQDGYTVSHILQTYLESEPDVTHRVRMRAYTDRTVYTETRKVRIDKISAYEDEREISEGEYLSLLENIRSGTHTLVKTRHSFTYLGQTFEVDTYPEWENSAILETELESRDTRVKMPPFIRIIAEVSGDKHYSNASMAESFPEELI